MGSHARGTMKSRPGTATACSPTMDLQQAQFFRCLPPSALHWAEQRVERRKIYPRRQLFSAGDPALHLWVVERGEVRLVQTSARGQVTTLEALGPGEMFGLWSGEPEERYAATAEGLSDGRVWRLSREAVAHLKAEVPALSGEMVGIIAERLRDAHARLHSFAHDPVPARLADALLRAGDGREAHVTRKVLAEASGTTVETAIRVMRRFEREGLVRGEVGAITILDARRLEEIAHTNR